MYCIITTCSVECHWHCTVMKQYIHYKSYETEYFCGFSLDVQPRRL